MACSALTHARQHSSGLRASRHSPCRLRQAVARPLVCRAAAADRSGSRLGGSGGGGGGDRSLADPRLVGALQKEPVAFWGGLLAGALGLSLDAGVRGMTCSGATRRLLPLPAYPHGSLDGPLAALHSCVPTPLSPPVRPPKPTSQTTTHAEPLKSWIQDTAAESGLRYQATVQRLESERATRASYDA